MRKYLIGSTVLFAAILVNYAFHRPPQQRLFHFTLTEQQTSELYDVINKSSAPYTEVVDVFGPIQEQVQAQIVPPIDTSRKVIDSTAPHPHKK